jgi:hypothetical protein
MGSAKRIQHGIGRTWRGQDGQERVRWYAAYKDQHGGVVRSSLSPLT